MRVILVRGGQACIWTHYALVLRFGGTGILSTEMVLGSDRVWQLLLALQEQM